MASVFPATISDTARCVFCTGRGDIEGFKAMPCSHIFCNRCLTTYYETNDNLLKCPLCNKVYDLTPESLPSAHQMKQVDDSILCQVCTKSGEDGAAEIALIYCLDCEKLYCVKHQVVHDNFLDDHERVDIVEYKSRQKKLKKWSCKKHEGFLYSEGCRRCLVPLCARCISQSPNCPDGSVPHLLHTLDEKMTKLIPLDKIKSKEDEMADFYKRISEVVDELETETENMKMLLQQRRDEELAEIEQKYKLLETVLAKSREKTSLEITEFMEENVGAPWLDLGSKRQKIEAKLEQADELESVLMSYKKMRENIDTLLTDEIPELQKVDVMILEIKENKKGAKEPMVIVKKANISPELGLTYPPPECVKHLDTPVNIRVAEAPTPKLIKLLDTVGVSARPQSVCQYKGVTYVGLADSAGVDSIDENNNSTKSFLPIDGCVHSVVVHNDIIYALSFPQGLFSEVFSLRTTAKISIYDLTGKYITSWGLTDTSSSNQVVVMNNQIIVANRYKKSLDMYPLDEGATTSIPCPLLGNEDTRLCVADNNSVVISKWKYVSALVFKVNISTGAVLWECSEIREPLGVACYGDEYLFVSEFGQSPWLHILSLKTGMVLTKVSTEGRGSVYDLHISGDTLVMPRRGTKNVQFYQIA